MIVGVPRETFPGERRVALVPAVISTLSKASLDVFIESSAGASAGFPNSVCTGRVVDRDLGDGNTMRSVRRGSARAAQILSALGISERNPPTPPTEATRHV